MDSDQLEKLIFQRRSIRKYKADMPPAAWIDAMVACGARAPSPCNSQPVRFVRINSEEIRKALQEAMRQSHREFIKRLAGRHDAAKLRNLVNACQRYALFMFDAPVLFAVGTATDVSGFSKKLFEAQILSSHKRQETDLDITVGLALKGFILKGEMMGLGTCILTAPLIFLCNVEETLGVAGVCIKCFVTVGFADETPPIIERKKVTDIYWEV